VIACCGPGGGRSDAWARIAVAVLAAAVLVWLAVGLRSAQLESEGDRLVGKDVTRVPPTRLAEASDVYLRAAELTPDTGPEVGAAAAANFRGRRAEALDLLRDVVRREPDSFDAWIVLAGVATGLDPQLAARARVRARMLNPLAFRASG
jgi:hypothetical protein